MKVSSDNIFFLKSSEIEAALESEYRQYFIGDLSKPQLLDYLEQGDLEIGTSLYREAKADTPHMHSRTSEILYIIKGEYHIFDLNTNTEYILYAGDFFVLPPNTPYASKAKANTQVFFIKTGGNDKIEIVPDDITTKWLEN